MQSFKTSRLVVAIALSATVVLSAPFLGQLRAYLRAAFPGQFVAIVGAAVALAMAGAFVVALARIRHARAIRYAVIAAAVGAAIAYSLATQTGFPEVDVVERVHFIEYGVIALLFYTAFGPLGDSAMFVVPVLAALTVGTLDEWLQWFIPNRVGEARDVFLNLVAIACGLGFGAALDPPRALTLRMTPRSRQVAAVAGAGFILVFAGFVNAVHLGHVLRDPDVTFRSHYQRDELRELSADRAERWRVDPPIALKRLSREDQYLDEGLWHIRERNLRWTAADYDAAFLENEILERYFAPVIDTTSYAAPEPSRWPAGHKADARQRAKPRSDFISEAEPYPIVTVWGARKWQFWSLVLTLVVTALLFGYSSRMRRLLHGSMVLVALATVACHPGPVIGGGPSAPTGGTIAGIVTSEGKAAVVGRKVTAVDTSSGTRFEATTGANGGYTIKVPEGTYRLEVELRPGEKVAKQPEETRVNRSDLDPQRDFVISGVRAPG
jgi:hypothetical protein